MHYQKHKCVLLKNSAQLWRSFRATWLVDRFTL